MHSQQGSNCFNLFSGPQESRRYQSRGCKCDFKLFGSGKTGQVRAKEGVLVRAIQKNDTAQVAALLVSACCWPDRILHGAVKAVTTSEVARAFAASAPAFFWDRCGGVSGLMWAVSERRADVVHSLLAAGVKPDADAPWNKTRALPTSLLLRDAYSVEVLLDWGADPRQTFENGLSPIHLAAEGGEVACIRALLRRGVDAGARDQRGLVPLHLAARRGAAECVRALLDAGADPNAREEKGNNPLHFAAKLPYCYADIPGKYRSLRSRAPSAPPNFLDCVRQLLEKGADVNAVDVEEFTPLSLAIHVDDAEIARALMDNGADLHYRLRNGDTVVHQAASSRYTARCVAEVLERSDAPNVDSLNDRGDTPLLTAVRCGNSKVVEELLRFGANANVRDANGYTVLHRAAEIGSCEMAVHLLCAGADARALASDEAITPLHIAARHNDGLVLALLENGADINARAANGSTPLHYSPNLWNHNCLEQLISHGADLLARDDAGLSVLHYAARGGYLRTIDFLLLWGFPLDDRTYDGRTALHVATGSLQRECVLHLLRNLGANANVHDATGRTPLHLAAHAADEAMVRALLLAGAQRTPRDDFGDAPADVAVADYLKRLIRSWALAA